MYIMIVGTGRCGTTTLKKQFEKIDKIVSLHEGKGKYKGEIINIGDMKEVNICSERYDLNSREFKRVKRDALKSRIKIAKKYENEKIIVDSNRMGYRMIDELYNSIENVKIIHLIRNGYSCVSSWYNRESMYPDIKFFYPILRHYLYNLKKDPNYVYNALMSMWAYLMGGDRREDIKKLRADNQFTYSIEKPIPRNREKWYSNKRIHKISWFWMYVNKYIDQKLKDKKDGRVLNLKIENLDSDKFKKILNWIGVNCDGNVGKVGKHNVGRSEGKFWSKNRIKIFNSVSGEYMKSCGYPVISNGT